MEPRQATQLVNKLRDNWDSPPWSQDRYDLFVMALLPYPYDLAAPIVGEVIRKGGKSYRVVVSDLTVPLDLAVTRQKALAHTAREQKLLAAPPDPRVKELLRDCVMRLQAKAARAFGQHGEPRPAVDELTPSSTLTGEELAKRRAFLRQQAERLKGYA